MTRAASSRSSVATRLQQVVLCVLLFLGPALVTMGGAGAVKPLPQKNVKQAPRKDLSKKMERLNTVDMMIAVRLD